MLSPSLMSVMLIRVGKMVMVVVVLKLHCKMKAEDEWSALKSKVTGLEQRYKRIACILALCPLSELADSSLSVNPSCKVSIL
jgi:hypothetical protein